MKSAIHKLDVSEINDPSIKRSHILYIYNIKEQFLNLWLRKRNYSGREKNVSYYNVSYYYILMKTTSSDITHFRCISNEFDTSGTAAFPEKSARHKLETSMNNNIILCDNCSNTFCTNLVTLYSRMLGVKFINE